jgi:anti-sigma regulatory factor (Ser/Thr protein kinase)
MMAPSQSSPTGANSSPQMREETPKEYAASQCNWPCLEIHSARNDWVELSLPCVLEAADQFTEFSVWFFAELQEDTRDALRMALRELILNAIEWGGKLDGAQRVRVAILRGQHAVLCRIADPGKGFRFDNLSHAAISNPADNPCNHLLVREQLGLRAGGFGLSIVQASIDELLYNDSGNEVVFIKYLRRRAALNRISCS